MASEQQASTQDSVYSIAENVRRVAGTEEKKTKIPATVTKRAARPKTKIASKKANTLPKTTLTKTVVVSKEKREEPEKQATADDECDEYINIKPGWFWKISTAVLAILVIWAYFFR